MARSHEALWLGASATIAAGAVALVGVNATLDSVRPHYTFWTTGIMIAAYAAGALAVVCFAGALRGWFMPLAGDRPHRGSALETETVPTSQEKKAGHRCAERRGKCDGAGLTTRPGDRSDWTSWSRFRPECFAAKCSV